MLFQITKKQAKLLLAGAVGLCLLVSSYWTTLAGSSSLSSPILSPANSGNGRTENARSGNAGLLANPPDTDDFFQPAPQGLGNPENMWAWGMIWWGEHLYVGTSRNFDCADTLAQARNSFGIIVYPPTDPDLNCPEDPLTLDMRAEIWRYHPPTNQWERVYQSPVATDRKSVV